MRTIALFLIAAVVFVAIGYVVGQITASRYQMAVDGGMIVRLDTRTGKLHAVIGKDIGDFPERSQ